MITLFEVDENNFLELAALQAAEEQKRYLDSALGILARGYVYRDCRARVFGVAADGTAVGLLLVRDLDEEPACYDLQQFLIDRRFQGKGYGGEALTLLLRRLGRERAYPCVEVCVHRENAAALAMFQRAGFADTGYIDEGAPDCLNLRCTFAPPEPVTDTLISDFTDPAFRTAFRQYFGEMGITVSDWDGLFREMNGEGTNLAWLRQAADGGVIGFLQFQPMAWDSWFFTGTCGFLREFWVAETDRNRGHGAALLRLTEDYFVEQGILTCILTTDTAEPFYRAHGYLPAPACRAKNGDPVLVKRLAPRH